MQGAGRPLTGGLGLCPSNFSPSMQAGMQGAGRPLTGVWGCAPATSLPRAAAGGEVTGSLTKHLQVWQFINEVKNRETLTLSARNC